MQSFIIAEKLFKLTIQYVTWNLIKRKSQSENVIETQSFHKKKTYCQFLAILWLTLYYNIPECRNNGKMSKIIQEYFFAMETIKM